MATYFQICRWPGLLAACFLVLTACSSGPMDIEETYYLKATNGQYDSYIRVQVEGRTRVSDARYQSGWYLAEAVDAVFGNVAEDPTGTTGAARDAMRDRLIEALKAAQDAYLTVALNENATDAQVMAALQRWKRVRFAPGFANPEIEDAILVEHNPGQSIETLRAGKKLVFFLSANPDQIIQSISSFSNDAQTKVAIQRFSEVMIQNQLADIEERKAAAGVDAQLDKVLATRVNNVATRLKAAGSKPDIDAAIGELEALRSLADSIGSAGGQP